MNGMNLFVNVPFRGLFQMLVSIKTTKFVLFIKILIWHLFPKDFDSVVLGCVTSTISGDSDVREHSWYRVGCGAPCQGPVLCGPHKVKSVLGHGLHSLFS